VSVKWLLLEKKTKTKQNTNLLASISLQLLVIYTYRLLAFPEPFIHYNMKKTEMELDLL